MIVLTVMCLVAANPQLDLKVNSTRLAQCDHLVVKSVITNISDSGVYIERKLPGPSIQFEREAGGSWTAFRGMEFRDTLQSGGPLGEAPLLESHAAYAEYNVILLDEKDRFLFGEPGKVALRAVVQVSDKRLESSPVEITVRPRAPSMVKRIKEVGISVATLGGRQLVPPLPDKLVALEDVGGNIGNGVKNMRLMARIVTGEEKTGDDVVKYIRDRMDRLDAEQGFAILGNHYFTKQDWANLAKVNDAIAENSWMKWQWQASLDFHKLKEPPRIVVPERPQKP